MRLWSINPGYLDRQGLVALWRESLLAQKVLQEKTKGYKNHPQLIRFRRHPHPINIIGSYLYSILLEASYRGYNFDFHKIEAPTSPKYYLDPILVTEGQVAFEWDHFLSKVKVRSPDLYEKYKNLSALDIKVNESFTRILGGIEDWEKGVT